jgi:hypothetical protein
MQPVKQHALSDDRMQVALHLQLVHAASSEVHNNSSVKHYHPIAALNRHQKAIPECLH